MWSEMSFEDADDEFGLQRFEHFDAEFDTVFVHRGELRAEGDLTAGDLLRGRGLDPGNGGTGELVLHVVAGDLVVGGALLLDEEAPECLGLLVTGNLRAAVVSVDATLLYVHGDAAVSRLIDFTTTDGTLQIFGATGCPLLLHADGDLWADSDGVVHSCRSGEPAPVVAEVMTATGVDSRLAVEFARLGRPVLAG
ncbi:hypothetical protein [Actinocorallia longicatena]